MALRMKNRPYIEPSIRSIAGVIIITCVLIAVLRPEWSLISSGALIFVGFNLFQSGFTRFCLMEKFLKRIGFRSEMGEIRSMAIQDALTKLPNRVLMEDRVKLAISQAQRSDQRVGLLVIDLDTFKHVNDVYGHKVGDQLLINVSKALKSQLRPYDTLARWGGDEFALLLPDLKNAAEARYIGNKLLQAVAADILPEFDVHTTLSIGAAVYPDDASNVDTLFMQADKALYYAKTSGRNNIQVFNTLPEAQSGILNVDLTARLAAAVKTKTLQVHFQPILDAQTNQVTCVEALARWYDHTYGWISPAMFIPMAENLGLIEEIGLHVIETALEHYSSYDWNERVKLSVNISNREFFSRPFKHRADTLIRQHNLLPEHFVIEITESGALDTSKARDILKRLTTAGFTISLDDFGTGFSSLSLIHELDLHELKIDRSFVARAKTKEGKAMIKTIIEMSKAMQLSVIAEGVEDEETADLLRDMGVNYLQGYYFSRPLPHDECNEFIINNINLNDTSQLTG